jgi:hypothetical protein
MLIEQCAICGKEFKIFPCRKNVTKCCSYECRNKLIVKTRRELYEKSKMNSCFKEDVCVLPKEMIYDGYKVYMNGKYPAICINGKNHYLHRYVWEQTNGPIPKNMVIHHKDFNRGNWNLENLELLTRAEHMKLHKINYEDKSTMLLSYMDKTIMKGEDDLS